MNKLTKYIMIVIAGMMFISIVISCGAWWRGFSKKSAELTITNNTNQEISNVTIEYMSAGKKIDMGVLKPSGVYSHKIEDRTDDSIKLTYTDPSGIKHEEIVIGYVTKGIKEASAIIKKASDGKWVVESKY